MIRRVIATVPWIAAPAALAAVLLAAFPSRVPGPGPAPDSAPRATAPSADTRTETWAIEPQAPPPASPAPAPRRSDDPAAPFDWGALRGGAAAIDLAPPAPVADPADLEVPLTAAEARALLDEAERQASGGAVPRGTGVVIGRGTPRGGADGGPCRQTRTGRVDRPGMRAGVADAVSRS